MIRKNYELLPDFDWNGLFAPENYSNINTLFITSGNYEAYRPIMFSSNEIFCSRKIKTEYDEKGRMFKLQAPSGSYDINKLLEKLPHNWKPDLLVLKADSSKCNVPYNLDKVKCRKVFIMGDTHHLPSPVRFLIDYLRKEKFDYITSDHDRHHLHFVVEAGFSNCFWMPGINIYPHLQQKEIPIKNNVAFIGNVGKFHPYRCHIIQAMKKHCDNTLISQLPHEEAATAYASSHLSLNCSLNGDLNLRVFEIMSSGGFLLTDTLAPESGLNMLFECGKEFDTYGNAEELTEKLSYYLDHPELAAEIAAAGFKRFWKEQDPRVKIKQFFDFIHNGTIDDERYMISCEPRCTVPVTTDLNRLRSRITKYEFLQELQLHNQYPQVLILSSECADLISDATDLPRMNIYTGGHAKTIGLTKEATLKIRKLSDSENIPAFWNSIIVDDTIEMSLHNDEKAVEKLLSNYPFDSLIFDKSPSQDTINKLQSTGLIPADENIPVFFWKNIALPARIFIEKKIPEALDFLAEKYGSQYNTGKIDLLAGIAWLNSPENSEAGLKRIRKYQQTNRLDRRALDILIKYEISHDHIKTAVDYLLDLVHGYPNDWENMNQLAGLFMQTNNYAEALRWYSKSLEINIDQDNIKRRIKRLTSRINTFPPNSTILSSSRILVITNLYPPQEMGGYGRAMFSFSNELKKRGHNIKVLTSNTPYLGKCPEKEPDIDRSIILYGEWIDGNTQIGPDPEKIVLKNYSIIDTAIDHFKPDFILLGNLDMIDCNIVEYLLKKYDVPMVHRFGFKDNTFHDHKLPDHPRYFFAGASHWVVQRNAPPKYKNCDHLYPGANTDLFQLRSPISTDRLNIAYASLIRSSKGIGTLIDALAILKSHNENFFCTVAGLIQDQEFYEELLYVCKANNFSHQVNFTGNLSRNELLKMYSASNVLVFPSHTEEAFGISPVEAMAAGLPVISTGQGGAAEVVENGISGIITKPRDPYQLADALESLPANPSHWAAMGKAAQQRALNLFDIKSSTDKLEQIFAGLVDNRK